MRVIHIALAHCFAGLMLLSPVALSSPSQGGAASGAGLKTRMEVVKPKHTSIRGGFRKDLITIKVREGLEVSAHSGSLVSPANDSVAAINRIIHRVPGSRVSRMFERPAEQLRSEKARGEAHSGEQLADLSLYFTLQVPLSAAITEVEAVIDSLNDLDQIEIAYPEPIPQLSRSDIAPTTPNFEGYQGYLNAAPQGIDARYAWTFPGGSGSGTRFIDIEGGWVLSHEDLKDPFFVGGSLLEDAQWANHGTAVLGQVIGDANGFGVSGIASAAGFGVHSIFGNSNSTANAINVAASRLSRGDVILIELHFVSSTSTGEVCSCNQSQCMLVPAEYFQANYDAIKLATANGITVVEAAGNGSTNLDHAAYGGIFDRNVRDSGAIMVGGGSSTNRSPMCWTNYGDRVDVQGWGEAVATTGYGGLFYASIDQSYTASFSGTSSASPIVTGAALSLQGIQKARTNKVLNPSDLRAILTAHGTPQGTSSKLIGPLPNLKTSIDWLLTPTDGLLTNGDVLALDCDSEFYGWSYRRGNTRAGTPLNAIPVRRYSGNCGIRTESSNAYVAKSVPAASVYTSRFYFYPDTSPTGPVTIFKGYDGSIQRFAVRVSSGRFELLNSQGSVIAQTQVNFGKWNLVEVRWAAGTQTTFAMRVGRTENDVPEGRTVYSDVQGVSTGASSDRVRGVMLGIVGGSNGLVAHFDAFSDKIGSAQLPPKLVRGDATGDSLCNSSDITAISRDVLVQDLGYGENRALAIGQPDCNEDGVVNSSDVTCTSNRIIQEMLFDTSCD